MADPIEEVWARIPNPHCRGLCHKSCGPIGMSANERARILDRHGILIEDAATQPGTLGCPALHDGRCRVYADRPTVCRLWGASAAMPCPHGCTPAFGLLDDETASEILRASLATDRPEAAVSDSLLGHVLRDPVAGPLFRRAMRGDRSVYPVLAQAIRAITI